MDGFCVCLEAAASVGTFAGVFYGAGLHSRAAVPSPRTPALADALNDLFPLEDFVRRRERARLREKVLEQMPSLLDIVTLGLSAGLSFDASLELYCSRYRTELGGELRKAMFSWHVGSMSRSDALEHLASELDVAALRRFSSAVSEALAFGSPLAHALERQAQVIRDEQRSEMEERIEKVPVKMLIPLGSLILPAMLLAILGPLLGAALVVG